MKTTIKEVYEQCLADGWLSYGEATVIVNNNHDGTFKAVLIGMSSDGRYVVQVIGTNRYVELKSKTEVEWVENQPKKKMLYKAFVGFSTT